MLSGDCLAVVVVMCGFIQQQDGRGNFQVFMNHETCNYFPSKAAVLNHARLFHTFDVQFV
jgi:hypothetical protein